MDLIDTNVKSFEAFPESYTLNHEEKKIYDSLLQKLKNYHAATTSAIEMATVDLTNSMESMLESHNYYQAVDKEYSQFSKSLYRGVRVSFDQLMEKTAGRFVQFIITIVILILGTLLLAIKEFMKYQKESD